VLEIFGNPAAGGGQVVADNGAVGAGGKALILLFAQLLPPAGHTDDRLGVDEAKQGHSGQDFRQGQRLQCSQWCSRNGGENIDRDRGDLKLAQFQGQIDAVRHRLAHADDPAGAERHPGPPRQLEGLNLVRPGVGGADLGEKTLAGFQVAMVAPHSCLIEGGGNLLIKQTGGSAEQQGGRCRQLLVKPGQFPSCLCREAAATGYQGKAVHTMGIVILGLGQGLLGRNRLVGVDGRLVPGRLGAPPAIFGAIAALGVDDRAEIEMVAHKMAADGIGGPVEFFLIAVEQMQCRVAIDPATREDGLLCLLYLGIHNSVRGGD